MKKKSSGKQSSLDDPAIRVLLRKPDSLVVTWLVQGEWRKQIESHFAMPWHELPLVLRLYDVTERGVLEDGADSYVDYEVNHEVGEWLLFGLREGKTYCVDLGIRTVGGRFYRIGRSNEVAIPGLEIGLK